MAVAALVAYVVWFGLTVGFRAALQLRRTGDTGLRGLSGWGAVEVLAGVGFVLALALGVAAPVADLAGLGRIDALDRTAVAAAGVAIASLGVALVLLAQLSMGDSWRIGVDPGERTPLVADGAFRVVRNPIFSTMILTSAGLTLMVPNVLSALGLLTLVVALEMQVRGVEEPHLRRTHGDIYRAYEAAVGRFVPGLGRRPR
jgi:protein-S-isoprenylcysteine O-methyltransferase Ste14